MAKYTSMFKADDNTPVYFDHESKLEALSFSQSKALDYVSKHNSIIYACAKFAVRDNIEKTTIIRGLYAKINGEIKVHIFEIK